MQTTVLSEYLSPAQLAGELNVSSRTLARWCGLGEGPATTRIGRKILFHRSAVEVWLKARTAQSGRAA